VVNIIDHTLAVADADQRAHHIDNVFFVERAEASLVFSTQGDG
jgi:hypothetical protein